MTFSIIFYFCFPPKLSSPVFLIIVIEIISVFIKTCAFRSLWIFLAPRLVQGCATNNIILSNVFLCCFLYVATVVSEIGEFLRRHQNTPLISSFSLSESCKCLDLLVSSLTCFIRLIHFSFCYSCFRLPHIVGLHLWSGVRLDILFLKNSKPFDSIPSAISALYGTLK